jgi:hypothetical protein
MFDGKVPSLPAIKTAAHTIAEYGFISNLDTLNAYALDEEAILQAITAKVLQPEQQIKEPQFDEEKSIEIVFEIGKDGLVNKNVVEFQIALTNALKNAMRTNTNQELIKAVEILSAAGAEGRIPAKVRKQYYMDSRVFEAIKFVHSMVCPKHCIVFR